MYPFLSRGSSALEEKLLELQVHRLSHMEILLVGLATLASAGWAALFKIHLDGDWTGKAGSHFGLSIFTILFSSLVGSSYNSLFMGRTGINRNVLLLEDVLDPVVKPYRRFYEMVGHIGARIVFLIPALLLPAMALVAIIFAMCESVADGGFYPWGVWVVGSSGVTIIVFTTWQSIGLLVTSLREMPPSQNVRDQAT